MSEAGGDRSLEVIREAVERSFNRQGLMAALGGRVRRVDRGEVQIELPYSPVVTQQNGYYHAAAIAAIADNAGGYAALTVMDANEDVVAAEFKINLLRPAVGPLLVAHARVVRAGRTLVVSHVSVSSLDEERVTEVAVMLQTNFRVRT